MIKGGSNAKLAVSVSGLEASLQHIIKSVDTGVDLFFGDYEGRRETQDVSANAGGENYETPP